MTALSVSQSRIFPLRTLLAVLVVGGIVLWAAPTASAAATISSLSGPGTGSLHELQDRNGNAFSASGTATPLSTVTFQCRVDTLAFSACGSTAADGAGAWSFNYNAPGTPFAVGVHEFELKADDGGGSDNKIWTWRVEPPPYTGLVSQASNQLYAYWKLDDALGATTAVDSGPHGYNGDYKNYVIQRQTAGPRCERQPHEPFACFFTDNGAAIPDSGRDTPGYSAYFGGTDDHVEIENMPDTFSNSTVEAWVKPDFDNQERGIYQHQLELWTTSTGQFACGLLNYEDAPVTGGSYSSGNWYDVACTKAGAVLTLWVNGSAVGSRYIGVAQDYDPGSAHQGFIGLVNKTSGKWWKGWIDDVAMYFKVLPASELQWHAQTGLVDETNDYTEDPTNPGVTQDYAPPSLSDITVPANNSQYSPDAQSYKAPKADFACSDPAPGSGVASCTATVDGNGINDGDPLPLGVGSHSFVLTATDFAGNTWTHTHTYYVQNPGNGYGDLITCAAPAANCTSPVSFWRLDELPTFDAMYDTLGVNTGEYKNAQSSNGAGSGVVGGTGTNASRHFLGSGGYGYVPSVVEQPYGYTVELWVKPADTGDMMLFQHGGSPALYISGGAFKFRPEERASAISVTMPVAHPLTAGQWYFVAATYDGVTATLYVAQTAVSTVWGDTTTAYASNSAPVHYQPNGNDSLYVGYGDQLGGTKWLRGDMDEVAYYANTALASAKLRQHFEADPPSRLGYGAGKKTPAKAKAVSKLAKAKARVRSLTHMLAKAKAKLRYLVRHHRSRHAIAAARRQVKLLTKQLAKAKRLVRTLSHKKPAKHKPVHKKPAPKKSVAKRH